tara:strand:+ start:706 stop:1137 length:432 start_codon:yes stop_codon:yes gene_type:complete
MKLLFENWRKYLNEVGGLDTTWNDLHINDLFKITGKSCNEGIECKEMPASELEQKIKDKKSLENIKKHLDPERLETADYSFPLIVIVDNGEYQYILDGNHRLAVALAAEEKGKDAIVKVKELDNDEFEELLGDYLETHNETPT